MDTEVKGIDIATAGLRLRPLAEDDAPRIEALCGELAVARWLARIPHPYPPGEAARFVALSRGADERHWAIERRAEPGLIGVIGIDGTAGGESLGYWLGAPYSGRGYAGQAARATVDWAFAEAGIGRLASGAFDGNAAALRVQEKLGFTVTGRRMLRCEALKRDVLHIDTRLTRADWSAHRDARA